jgi:4-diphosphocytidyl-2-C-methyl-D-erythritol kinase
VVLNSCAKLNLYLAVLGKRKDAYHTLDTLFERIDLCDTIVLKPRRDNRIAISTDSPLIPRDRRNLAWRAAELLREHCGIDRGVDIRIVKRIPVGSGMGGGSSNAACVLTGLNRLWKLGLSRSRLVGLGKKLGADVPFFLSDTPFARGSQRGDRIKPEGALRKARFWHVVLMPRIRVSTPSVYKKWDRLPLKVRLTKPHSDVRLLLLALKKKDFSLIGERLFNSLEQVSLALYPEIGYGKEKLAELGLKSILMSGSGPAVFGMVSSRKEARSLGRQLKRTRRWQVFVTKTT